jgi:hypothetical protein
VKSAGSINEKGRFPFKRTTCAVSFTSGAAREEHKEGITHKQKHAVILARNNLFMNEMVPSDPSTLK